MVKSSRVVVAESVLAVEERVVVDVETVVNW